MARYDLQLSDDEFWSMSPRAFFALLNRHTDHERWLNYRAGLSAAAIYNVNRTSGDPIKPMAFFGEAERSHMITDGEVASVLDAVAEVSRQRHG